MDDFRPVETAPIFCLPTEAQVLHTPEARAIDYFELFYTQDIWQGLVADTNHYCDQHFSVLFLKWPVTRKMAYRRAKQ